MKVGNESLIRILITTKAGSHRLGKSHKVRMMMMKAACQQKRVSCLKWHYNSDIKKSEKKSENDIKSVMFKHQFYTISKQIKLGNPGCSGFDKNLKNFLTQFI